MKGSYEIEIISKKIKYKLKINRKITIIRGNTASGKSTLCRLISSSFDDKKIKVNSIVPVYDITAIGKARFSVAIKEIENSIIILDEDSNVYNEKNFAEMIKSSDNYFVFITRQKLGMIPFSYKEIYDIKYVNGVNILERTYKDFEDENLPLYEGDLVLVEDSKSGLQLYKNLFDGVMVETSEGKTNIPTIIKDKEYNIIIADGAAIGSEIEDILLNKKNSSLFLPESVEYVILKSMLFDNETNDYVESILDDLYDNIDSKMYFSWENYFTDILIKVSNKYRGIKYTKTSINKWYITPKNKEKLLNYLSSSIKYINYKHDNIDIDWI